MKYKDFSPNFYSNLKSLLEQIKSAQESPCVAFDADGTLWDFDLGEEFFKYQIKNQLVPLPKNPWEYYHQLKLKNNDPREAYLWLAQVNEGKAITTVRGWAKAAVEKLSPLPVFQAQKNIIELFQKNNIDVYVVTASVKWAVEPGAALLGIPEKNVIGVQTKISNDGLVTTEQEGPITYKPGKVSGLLHYNGNRVPFFCSGNTMGDWDLLNSASHLRLAVSACTNVETELFKTEAELQKQASAQGWITHLFTLKNFETSSGPS